MLDLRKVAKHVVTNALTKIRHCFRNGEHPSRLLILDDVFPQMISAFRIAEFNGYLDVLRDVRIYSTAKAFPIVGETRPFRTVLREYEGRFPEYRGKVAKYDSRLDLRSDLIYTVFLHNAFHFIHIAERQGSAFVFTLYPGGGFSLHDKESDGRLRRVLSSPAFRKVIVTQRVSYDYLIAEQLCAANQIEFIYGGVFPSHLFAQKTREKRYYRDNKDTFDICFVANKYMPRGIDKGYDVFVEVARLLTSACKDVIFHVVGPFTPGDIDVSDIGDKVFFHGVKYTDFFRDFYAETDIILSPNRPSVLAPGAFDGFPTGACVEAGLCGVAVFCADPLQQNSVFQDREEIVIIQPKAREICDQILPFYQEPNDLYALSGKGQKAFRRLFDFEAQINPRLEVLSRFMGSI